MARLTPGGCCAVQERVSVGIGADFGAFGVKELPVTQPGLKVTRVFEGAVGVFFIDVEVYGCRYEGVRSTQRVVRLSNGYLYLQQHN